MGELSIAVERVGAAIHVLRVAGDLDEDGSARLRQVIDGVTGLQHAIVDLGNVRSYSGDAFGRLLDDDRVIVTGLAGHLPLLPGWVADQLGGLRTAHDIDSALRQAPAGRPSDRTRPPRRRTGLARGHGGLVREPQEPEVGSVRLL
jgi:hypothetical protein